MDLSVDDFPITLKGIEQLKRSKRQPKSNSPPRSRRYVALQKWTPWACPCPSCADIPDNISPNEKGGDSP